MKTKLLIEQHFHGCYGVDFNKADANDIIDISYRLKKEGIGGIFPTLVTDNIENIKRQVNVIKTAASKQTKDCAKILGIHLEGIFINPVKKGIHNPEHILLPTIENYLKIADDFIKIVTLAPELCECSSDSENLINYLGGCSGVTHMYNAMKEISHRDQSTSLSALINDDLYTEVIADGVHVNDDALKLLFKVKPVDKIILVSDCLPCTKSDLKSFIFADEKVYYDGNIATSATGTLAGSTKLLPEIIKILGDKGLFNVDFINNPYQYHQIDLNGSIEWDSDYNIVKVI